MMKQRALGIALLGMIVAVCAVVALPDPTGTSKTAADNTAADPKNAQATARTTAYVDFVKLLKTDPQFLTLQWQTMVQLEADMRDEASAFEAKRANDQKDLAKLSPDSMEYRDLMKNIIESSAASNRKRLMLESEAQRIIDEEAQKTFRDIKDLVAAESKKRGYTQVMVISTTPAKGRKFEELQKELLLSPVLIYPEEDDLTKVVEKEILRRGFGYLEIGDPTAKEGTLENDGIWLKDEKGAKLQRMPADKTTNPDDIWFDVKLGSKVQFECLVTDLDGNDKRVTATAANGVVEWSLPKLQTGIINAKNGLYDAPAGMPAAGDIVPVRVACTKALYKVKTIRIRLK